MMEDEGIKLIKINNENEILENPFIMKAIDLYEIRAENQGEAVTKLLRYFNISTETYFIKNKYNSVIGIFGVREVSPTTALPWALTSEIPKEEAFSVISASNRIAKIYKEKYSVLYNYTACENTVTQKWLEYLGFTIYKDDVCRMWDGIEMYRFEWRK